MEFGKAQKEGRGLFIVGASVAMAIAVYAAVPVATAPTAELAAAAVKPHLSKRSTTASTSSTTTEPPVSTTTVPVATTAPATSTTMPMLGLSPTGGASGSSGGSGNSYGPGQKPSAICRDGTYSYSQTHSGTCSHHGGVAQWLQ